MMSVMSGARRVRQALARAEGMGSSGQVELSCQKLFLRGQQ